MKLHADNPEGTNAISRHGIDGVIVGGIEYTTSVLVPWQGAVQVWPVSSLADLTDAHFAMLTELRPEIVLFGSGPRIRFLAPALLRPLFDLRIGVETMDTAAACRTYNVLLAEGRSVVAALLIEGSPLSPA